MTGPIRLPAGIAGAIVAVARAAVPNEACGIVIGDRPVADGGRPLRFVATPNAVVSPFRYEIDPPTLVRLALEAERAGEVFWAIVHSHVRSAARPSETDVERAFYPGAIHLIAGPVEGAANVELRAWTIPGPGRPAVELPVEIAP